MKVTDKNIGAASGRLDVKSTKGDGIKALKDERNSAGSKALENSSNVNLSERAQMMQRAKDIASKTTIDEAKVSRLQKLIDEGQYKVGSAKVADILVDEHMNTPD